MVKHGEGGEGTSYDLGRAALGTQARGGSRGMAARWSRIEIGTLLTLAFVGLLWLGMDRLFARDLRLRRESLLARTAAETAALSPAQARFLPTAERVIVELARAGRADFDADQVSDELSAPGALDELLRRPWGYFRGVQPEVPRPEAVARAAWASWKDGFVLCATEPPATSRPEDLYATARRYYMRGALFEDATADVTRLANVHRGIRVLTPGWADEVRASDDALWLRRLELEEAERTSAAVARAKAAAASRLLIVVIDELPPGRSAPEVGPSLTDGQRESILPLVEEEPHWARVLVHDLEADRPLLRLRRHLDARRLGISNSLSYTAVLQGCELAVETRALAAPDL